MNNYLVSVFLNGKHVHSYFSKNLDDLVTIKALHKGCEIDIADIHNFVCYSESQVENEIKKSVWRWRESAVRAKMVEDEVPQVEEKPKKQTAKKNWDRPVRCVETGQVFMSIRECCDHLGLSYKSVWNAINSGNARCGLHFEDFK